MRTRTAETLWSAADLPPLLAVGVTSQLGVQTPSPSAAETRVSPFSIPMEMGLGMRTRPAETLWSAAALPPLLAVGATIWLTVHRRTPNSNPISRTTVTHSPAMQDHTRPSKARSSKRRPIITSSQRKPQQPFPPQQRPTPSSASGCKTKPNPEPSESP